MRRGEITELRRGLLRGALERLVGAPDADLLAAVESSGEWLELPSGEVLFRQGDPGDSLYLLLSGRLDVRVRGADDVERRVGEVGRGESVGEMALLTHEARSATLLAARDSVLVRLDAATIPQLVERHPVFLTSLARLVVGRLRARTAHYRRQPGPLAALALAVLPLGPEVRAGELAAGLVGELGRFGRARLLDEPTVAAALGSETAEQTSRLAAWLDAQEAEHRFLVYVSDGMPGSWTRRCLRQADVVLLVADARADPRATEAERLLDADQAANRAHRLLVLLQPPDRDEPCGTSRWLAARRVEEHLHLRAGAPGELARLARLLAGESVALVLGGGGARGFAHVGIFRALEELGIPVDAVCGASIGAVVAAGIARGWSGETLLANSRHAFLEVNPFADRTLPLVALLRGRKLDHLLRHYYSIRIEDLWLPFFCVSSNLTTSGLVVHREGELWSAVRASAALPGVFPPAVSGNSLLIDGGVLDNLPIDVLRETWRGRIIAVDLHVAKEYRLAYDEIPGPWKILASRLLPFRRPIRVPRITTIMMKANEIGSIVRAAEAKAGADLVLNPPVGEFGILDVTRFDEVVEAGYRHALERLADWPGRRGLRGP